MDFPYTLFAEWFSVPGFSADFRLFFRTLFCRMLIFFPALSDDCRWFFRTLFCRMMVLKVFPEGFRLTLLRRDPDKLYPAPNGPESFSRRFQAHPVETWSWQTLTCPEWSWKLFPKVSVSPCWDVILTNSNLPRMVLKAFCEGFRLTLLRRDPDKL